MPEIQLILSPHGADTPSVSVAISPSSMGVAAIPARAIADLLRFRDRLIGMLKGEPRYSTAQLQESGQLIRTFLFNAEIGTTWIDAAHGSAGLVTGLIATTPELKAIPWEYAAWPNAVDGPHRDSSIVRLVPRIAKALPPLARAKDLRVLMLLASPQGMEGIDWQDLRDTQLRLFSRLEGFELVVDDETPAAKRFMRIVEGATRQGVIEAIKRDNPHIVHFVGHGSDQGIALVDSRTRQADLMPATAFRSALEAAPALRLVILSACDGANPLPDQTPHSVDTLAEHLVRNVVPAVVANQIVVNNRSIRPFCEALYLELLESGSIDRAVAAGRCQVNSVLADADSAAIEWGIPVLYRRLGAAQIFV